MAKGIDLGLESLLSAGKAAPVLSFETLDNLVNFFCAADDVLECTRQLNACLETLDNLHQIRSCISKYGVTQSLEALYGENFRSAASMEEDAKDAEKGIMAKIGEWFKKLWEKIQNFFGWLFKTGAAARREIGNAKFGEKFTIKQGDKDVEIASEGQFEQLKKEAIENYDTASQSKKNLEESLKKARDEKNEATMKSTSERISQETTKLKEAVATMWKLIKNGKKSGKAASSAPADNADANKADDKQGKPAEEPKKNSLRW